MATSVSVVYASRCVTWSLLRAAVTAKLIKPQLLALNLLLGRKKKRLLESSDSKTGLASCPLKVLYLIKDQIYIVGIESVTASWKEDFLSEYAPPIPQNSSDLMTSREWEYWADPKAPLGDTLYDEWTWNDETCPHSKIMLLNGDKTEIIEFLSTLGLGVSGNQVGRIDSKKPNAVGQNRLDRLFTLVFSRLAHSDTKAICFTPVHDQGVLTGALELSMDDILGPSPSTDPFTFLYEKYHVEFLDSPTPPIEASVDEETSDSNTDDSSKKSKKSAVDSKLRKSSRPDSEEEESDDEVVQKTKEGKAASKKRREESASEKRKQLKIADQEIDLLKRPNPRWMLVADRAVQYY